MEVPGSGKTAPRAAASHYSGDLDRQGRLAVERAGHDGHALDPETVQCTRWVAAMEQGEAEHG
jgi:hypothetical protein